MFALPILFFEKNKSLNLPNTRVTKKIF